MTQHRLIDPIHQHPAEGGRQPGGGQAESAATVGGPDHLAHVPHGITGLTQAVEPIQVAGAEEAPTGGSDAGGRRVDLGHVDDGRRAPLDLHRHHRYFAGGDLDTAAPNRLVPDLLDQETVFSGWEQGNPEGAVQISLQLLDHSTEPALLVAHHASE